MHESISQAAIHSVISVIILFIFTRMAGKKQISQLSFFHYVIGISIGSIAAAFAVDLDIDFPEFITSVIIYGVFPLILSWISIKSQIGRKILNGAPTLLIQDGKIIEENLRKTKININELLEECRLKNAFNISEVEFAILETNGEVSVQMKPESLPLTPKDVKIPTQYKGICSNMIIDGAILEENMKIMNKSKDWLKTELEKKDIKSAKDVLLAFVDSSDNFYVYKKNDNPKTTPTI